MCSYSRTTRLGQKSGQTNLAPNNRWTFCDQVKARPSNRGSHAVVDTQQLINIISARPKKQHQDQQWLRQAGRLRNQGPYYA